MPRARHQTRGNRPSLGVAAILAGLLAACTPSTAAGPSGDDVLPVLGGRGGSSPAASVSGFPPLATDPPQFATGPMTTLDEFRATFSAFAGTVCGEVETVGELVRVRCDATDPMTRDTYEIIAAGRDQRIVIVSTDVTAASGARLEDATVGAGLGNIIAAVTRDTGHPGIEWVRAHSSENGASTSLGGFRFLILRALGIEDPALGRALVISLPTT